MNLDFATLIALLASRNATERIRGATYDNSPVKYLTSPLEIELHVKGGHLIFCHITDKYGRVVSGEEAQKILRQFPYSSVDWEFAYQQTPPPYPIARISSLIPRRTKDKLPETSIWPYPYRQVYLAADGRQDIKSLAGLFRCTPEQMYNLLKEFQERNLLILEERN